jgi:hypothetical protein
VNETQFVATEFNTAGTAPRASGAKMETSSLATIPFG